MMRKENSGKCLTFIKVVRIDKGHVRGHVVGP